MLKRVSVIGKEAPHESEYQQRTVDRRLTSFDDMKHHLDDVKARVNKELHDKIGQFEQSTNHSAS